MKTVPFFRKALGWNNMKDPADLVFDAESGACELQLAHNIDVSRGGRVSRRKGWSKKASFPEGCHSLFSANGIVLFRAGTMLYQLFGDYSYRWLIGGFYSGQRCDYAEVNGCVYIVSEAETFKIVGGVVSQWHREGDYVGPDTAVTYADPPHGEHVAYFKSRMLVAKSDTLFFSEPAAYSWFNLNYGFRQFGSKITMLRPVRDGVFVSTQTETWKLIGEVVPDMRQELIAPYPAVEWSMAYDLFDAKRSRSLIEKGFFGQVGVWLADMENRTCVCVGGEGVAFENVTKDVVDAPTSRSACGVVFDDKYIGLIQP